MPNNLNLITNTFANSMFSGIALIPETIFPILPFSIGIKSTILGDKSGGFSCLIGMNYGFEIAYVYSNTLQLILFDSGGSGTYNVTTATAINDGNLHDIVAVFDTNGTRLYVDQAQVFSTSQLLNTNEITVNSGKLNIGIGCVQNADLTGSGGAGTQAQPWGNLITQCAIYNYAFGTGNTCPTRPNLIGSETGLIAAWPLINDGNDIKGQSAPAGPATTLTLTPSTANVIVGVPLTFTLTANGTLTGNLILSDNGAKGAFFPNSPALVSGNPSSATFIYTPKDKSYGGTVNVSARVAGSALTAATCVFTVAGLPTVTGVTKGYLKNRRVNGKPRTIMVNPSILPGGAGFSTSSSSNTGGSNTGGSNTGGSNTGDSNTGGSNSNTGGSNTGNSNTTPGTAPARLSGLNFTQTDPLSMDAGAYVIAGYLDPVDGIGPFVYSDNGGLYNAGCEYGRGLGNVDIYIYSGDISTVTNKTIIFKVTDGRGDTAFHTHTFTIANAPTLNFNNRLTLPNVWNDGFDSGPIISHNYGDGLAVLNSSTGLSSPNWTNIYGGVRWHDSSTPTPGNYPVTFQFNGRSLQKTIVIQDFTPITYIEFIPTVLSTATIVSTIIGRALATTPSNSPSWSINDPSGTLQIDINGNISVIKTPTSTGPFTFSITVSDNRATCTLPFTINVVAGNQLSANNITTNGMTLAFTNVTVNNTIGAPAVTGVTGTKVWRIVSQPNSFTEFTPRYLIDPATGVITAPLNLSAAVGDENSSQTDALVVTVSDGINTCTTTINVVVSWGSIVRTLYVGRGMSSAHGGDGFEHWLDVNDTMHYRGIGNGVWKILIYGDADPTYHQNSYINNYISGSPTIIIGVPINGQSLVTIGGPYAGNTAFLPGPSSKGVFVFGGCDSIIRNIDGYGVNDAYSDGTSGGEFIHYESGNGYAGNNAVQNCLLRNSSNNILCGQANGTLLIENSELRSAGTSHKGGGMTHNLYVDPYTLIVRNSMLHRTGYGHVLKARPKVATITHNRIFDGVSGRGASCIEMPNGGNVEIAYNIIEKGAMTNGQGTIQYAAEGLPRAGNSLYVHDNTISVLRQPGNHDGAGEAVYFFAVNDPDGNQATIRFENNNVFLAPGCALFVQTNGNPVPTNEIGTTYIPIPPVIDMTAPWGTNGLQIASDEVLYRSMCDDSFANAYGLDQITDRSQFRISAVANNGAVIANIRASNDLGAQGDNSIPNPFVAGTTWQFQSGGIYYPFNNTNPWAADGKFALTTNSDGTVILQKGTVTLAANSLEYVQLRATAPNGNICDHRFPIVVTA